MEIKINDKILNAALENENTLGEVLSGIEQWLANSGHRIAELKIDGNIVKASSLEDAFSKEINSIKNIDIQTTVTAELAAASLLNLLEDIDSYKNCGFEEKSKFAANWKETPTARFISAEMPDLFAFCVNTFSNGDLSSDTLKSITEEIQREVIDPVNEIKKLEPVLNEICARLIDLPLDIQTGKDARAAQTIQIFTAVTEKLFRIYKQLDSQGAFNNGENSEQIDKSKEELNRNFMDFSKVIRELLDAYEKNDTVLVGDLTEYEASPKLKELYTVIINNIKTQGVK